MALLPKGSLLSATAALLIAGAPDVASACGGFFCDQPPPDGTPMAVDQTGETILFVVGDGFIEAHIQIEYAAGADTAAFSWIVPVPEIPEIEVGSAQLIDNVLAATVPIFGFDTKNTCDPGEGSAGGGGVFLISPDGGGSGPTVVVEDTVGAFDYVVLQGGTSESVMAWLSSNGYAQNDQAPSILDEYLDAGSVFVAFRINQLVGVDDLHPVVIRYPGEEPCIPLRLTRIAAADDMGIRALVLGQDRAFPVNYLHVEPNRVRLDWENDAANYVEMVSRAVDEAGGRAFVTEYAGASRIVGDQGLSTQTFDASAFATLTVAEALEALADQELVSCAGFCVYAHPLIAGVMALYMPAPEGVAPEDFYACVECYANLIDQDAWDGVAFGEELRARIIDPMDHAVDLLQTWPYLTRLYTTISPHEMLSDPTFAEVSGLPDVARSHGGLRTNDCCGSTMRLPGGREVTYDSEAWPTWTVLMPWAERISEFQAEGPPAELESQTAKIDAVLNAHNAGACNRGGGSGGAGTSGDGPGWGESTGGTAASGNPAVDNDAGGCACSRGRGLPDAVGMSLLGLGLVGMRRRK